MSFNEKLISANQHGFVPGRNCITQLLVCLEDWEKWLEDGTSLDVIYKDFSKAFDSVMGRLKKFLNKKW